VSKGLFEQMGFEKLAAGTEQIVEGLPSFAPDMSLACQQDELLASQQSLKAPRRLAQLSLADTVEGFEQMPNHVKLVVDDLDAGAVGFKAIAEGLPHVDNRMGEKLSPPWTEPLPKLLEILLLAALHDVKEFRSTRPLEGTDHRPVGLAFAHGDLIGPQDSDAVQGPLGLDLLCNLCLSMAFTVLLCNI